MFKRCLSTHRSIRISNSKHAPSYIHIYTDYFTLFSFVPFFLPTYPVEIFHPTKTRKDSFSGGEIWRNCGKKVRGREEKSDYE